MCVKVLKSEADETTMKMKAQASLEYLMTYGWALLVILLVIVGLTWLLQSAKPPEMCRAPVGFDCMSPPPKIYLDGSNKLEVDVTLKNNGANGIEISGAGCVEYGGDQNNIGGWTFTSPPTPVTINPGHEETLTGIQCYSKSGNQLTDKEYKQGDSFKGMVYIKYRYSGESGDRIMVLDISGTVS